MEGLCDVFPSKCIKSIDEFKQLCRFQDEKFKRHCSAFIPHIPTGKKKLYYKQNDITQLVVQNIERTLLDSRLAHECNPYKWSKIDKKLRLPVKSVKKKYTDTRTSFRWNNTFLTKSYFTFGFRKTEKGEVHIIQTTAAPIVYYELYKSIPYKIDRMFNPADELKFKKYVLQPNRIYLISSGKVYMILTTQKTLFTVNRCVSTLTEEIKQKLKIKLKNPRSYIKFEQSKDHPIDPYEKPPKTPFLDEMTPKKRNSEKEKSKAKLTKLFNKPEKEFYQYLSDGEVEEGGFKRPVIETSPTAILLPENGTLILNIEQQTWPEIPQTELLYLNTSLQASDTTSQPENNTANDCLLNDSQESSFQQQTTSNVQSDVQEESLYSGTNVPVISFTDDWDSLMTPFVHSLIDSKTEEEKIWDEFISSLY